MPMENSEMDKVHKANSAKIDAAIALNVAVAAKIPSNVGRTEPAVNTKFMQGTTTSGVVPDYILTQRS